jgi:hypothetical protein
MIVDEKASADVWLWDFSGETFSRLTDEGATITCSGLLMDVV